MELLDIFDLEGNFLGTEERKAFYDASREEYARTGKVSRMIKSIRLLLMNSAGKIYLQKRSKNKSENPGLMDKTVGGHVSAGQSFDLTVVKECSEELGFPVAILSKKDFEHACGSVDLQVIGIFQKITEERFFSTRISAGKGFVQPYLCAFYIGYYDGSIRFIDGESSGVEVFDLEELRNEIVHHPEKFTEDVKYMLQMFTHELVPL
jgi:isopentenyldiphosphate isomerase